MPQSRSRKAKRAAVRPIADGLRHRFRISVAEVGFHGFMNTELEGGDEAYLRDVSARVDKILAWE